LLGRADRSSPKAAQRRATGAGLDGAGAGQAIVWHATTPFFCSSCCPRKALVELDRELAHGGRPFNAAPPAQAGVLDGEVKQLERRIVVGETAAGLFA
jgi:hypothetical protein